MRYETIRNNAVQSISAYQREWTNYNASDGGITLLELLSWMQEMQAFYLEQCESENVPLYLELLGMKLKTHTPSAVMAKVRVNREEQLYENTAFYVDFLRFEPKRNSVIGGEELLCCRSRRGDGSLLWECTGEELQYGRWMFGECPRPGDSFYLGFDRPLPPRSPRLLYFKLEIPEGLHRNPVSEDTGQLFSHYQMDYWDGAGWRKCRILEDETVGFVQSGCIRWMAESEMKALEGAFWLRFRLSESDYDIAPRLSEIDTRRVRLLQKETIAASRQIVVPVHAEGIYHISPREYFEEPGELELFVRTGKLYKKIESVNRGSEELEFRYLQAKGKLLRLLLVMRAKEKDIVTDWEATGLPGQVMELGDTHIMARGMQVLVEREDHPGEYRFWRQMSHFWKADSSTEGYCFQEGTGRLVFGNGDYGKIPEGRILVTDCVRTLGRAGGIKEQSVFRWRGGDARSVESVCEGEDLESAGSCLQRSVRETQKRERAITNEDYEILVGQTPGLIIRRVKAVSEKDNRITLIVEGGAERNKRLSAAYQREIRAWLEGKRMLGTDIQLKAPEYIPISVWAQIQVYEHFARTKQWIQETVEEFFRLHMGNFGAEFEYSRFYGVLDGLECVDAIRGLTVTATGRGVRFGKDGSFWLPERGLAVLEEVWIQLIQGNRG